MNQPLFSAPIGDFYEHPAQMRTIYHLEEMAKLTLQVYQNDLDAWQPIVAAPKPEGGYFIISGHRRRMARLFAFALSTWLSDPENEIDLDEEGIHIEQVVQFIGSLVETYEFVDAAAEALLETIAEREIEFVLFEGDQKAQILALQRANYGMVKPDMLGIAYSFQAALQVGATIAQIARNAGQHVNYVRNHLALTQIPQELAEQIADGTLAMSIGVAVADIPASEKRNGLALFVLSTPAEQLTAKAVKKVAKTLKKWDGLQLPLTTIHQAQRNIARVLVRLWHASVEAYPIRSWAAISSFIYQGINIKAPWEDAISLEAWFETLGSEHYYGEDGILWEAVVKNLLFEVNCDICPIAKLPKRQLRSDLSYGREDVLSYPCRTGTPTTGCIHGLAPSDPFHVRVPWDWAEHEGVIKESAGYVVQSFEALQKAWQAQADLEDAEDQAACLAKEAEEIRTQSLTRNTLMYASHQTTPTEPTVAEPTSSLARKGNLSDVTSEQLLKMPAHDPAHQNVATPRSTSASHVPSPIQKVRERITTFMQQHLTMNVDHPFATPCAKCQHKLEAPKDEAIPHCAWASPATTVARRLRFVEFLALKPQDVGKSIPVCRQFAPKGRWADIIPAHHEKAIMPREWVMRQLFVLNKSGNQVVGIRRMFEFLTGRPMILNDTHEEWFREQLKEQAGDLSDEQLWTLFIWAMAEWQRRTKNNHPFMAPADRTNSYFISLREVDFA